MIAIGLLVILFTIVINFLLGSQTEELMKLRTNFKGNVKRLIQKFESSKFDGSAKNLKGTRTPKKINTKFGSEMHSFPEASETAGRFGEKISEVDQKLKVNDKKLNGIRKEFSTASSESNVVRSHASVGDSVAPLRRDQYIYRTL